MNLFKSRPQIEMCSVRQFFTQKDAAKKEKKRDHIKIIFNFSEFTVYLFLFNSVNY